MRCVAVPVPTLRTLVDQAEALDSVLGALALRQSAAIGGQLTVLRAALKEVVELYHDAVADTAEGDEHVQLCGPAGPRRARHRDS